MLVTIIVSAAAAILIYRLGVWDGQSVSRGEKIAVPNIKVKKDKNESEKLQRGIKNILDYGINEGGR